MRGSAVSDGKYHLSDDQQRFFARHRSVASTPVRLVDDRMLGCLTVISLEEDEAFADPERRARFSDLADDVAVILENVLSDATFDRLDWGEVEPDGNGPRITPRPVLTPGGSVTAYRETRRERRHRRQLAAQAASRIKLTPGQITTLRGGQGTPVHRS